MASLNKVTLIGNLGQDPEMRSFPDGGQIANVSIATSEKWKDKATGEAREKTEWHRVVFRGKLALLVGQYLRKGSKIYVEGQLQTRKWQGTDGQDRYSTEIVVGVRGTMIMLDSRQGASTAAHEGGGYQGKGDGVQAHQRGAQATSGGNPNNPSADFNDDIPF